MIDKTKSMRCSGTGSEDPIDVASQRRSLRRSAIASTALSDRDRNGNGGEGETSRGGRDSRGGSSAQPPGGFGTGSMGLGNNMLVRSIMSTHADDYGAIFSESKGRYNSSSRSESKAGGQGSGRRIIMMGGRCRFLKHSPTESLRGGMSWGGGSKGGGREGRVG